MSRIGKRPIPVPKGVEIKLEERRLSVKGPKGNLSFRLPAGMEFAQKEGAIHVTRAVETPKTRELHGVTQAVIQNMVHGVTQGYNRELEIEGVGFKADLQGKNLKLSLGFSHPVLYPIPEGIQIKVTNQTSLSIQGCDKRLVGQVAADIRRLKVPEPYQGKGIRYRGEVIRRKVGKAAAGATGA